MRFGKLTACIFAVTVIFGGRAAAENNYLALERFDDKITNAVQTEGITSEGAVVKIAEAGAGNKALLSEYSRSAVSVSKKLSGVPQNEFVFSLKLMSASEQPVNMKIGMAMGSAFAPVLKIDNNVIKTMDGKPLGGINGKTFTKIAVQINMRAEVADIYVDGQQKVKGWKVDGLHADFDSLYVSKAALSGGVFMDDFAVYNGGKATAVLPASAYNSGKTDDIYIEQDAGDFTYFHSHAMYSQAQAYYNMKAYPKTNSIECERLDYKNINKGECIIFNKSTADDCYIDISLNKMKNYDSSRTYSYFYIASDVMVEQDGMKAQMFLLRDTKTTGSQINSVTANLNGRSIEPTGTAAAANVIKPGEWFRYEVFARLDTHTADIYLNGRLVAKNVALDENMRTLNLVRFSVSGNSGKGMIRLKNFEVTGTVNPPLDGSYEKTSIFPDDGPIKQYLSDKVSFHHFAGIMYKDRQRYKLLHNSIYRDGGLYLSEEDISRAFDIECKYDAEGKKLKINGRAVDFDGVLQTACRPMIQVCGFAKDVMGRYAIDDGFGAVIVSDEPMYFNIGAETPYYMQTFRNGYFTKQSTLQSINAFLFFERAPAETLKELIKNNGMSGVHPRLIAGREDFERVKRESASDEGLAYIVNMIISQADALMERDICTTYTFQDAFRQNGFAANFEKRMMYLGFAYQITGEKKYVDRAWLEIEGICKYPDINENHPIDAGSYSAGLALGYDWLYNGLTEGQRRQMEEHAERLSLSVMDRVFYAGLPGSTSNLSTVSTNVSSIFAKWISNYNLWVNGGLTLAAIAYSDSSPELCADLLYNSLRSVEYNLYGFAPDGQWAEGNQYWDVCMSNLAKIVSSLNTALGTDFGLMNYQGLDKTGYYAAGWVSPLGSIANGDTEMDEGVFSYYSQSFLSKYYSQKGLAYIRQRNLSGEYTRYGIYAPEANPIDALFYTAGAIKEDSLNIPRMIVSKGAEAVTVHEDYTNPEGFVFAAQGGQTTHYHAHNDSGAFEFDMLGVRWATDLGRDSYNLGVSDNQIYRKRTEGHNTLTINNGSGFSQKENTFAPLIRSEESETGGYAVYDLSELYADAASVIRGFLIGDDYTSLTVRDELCLNRYSEVYWFMHTRADIEILDEKTALLSKGGKSIVLQLETDATEFKLSVMDAVPLSSSPSVDGQGGNGGIRKVAICMKGNGNINLTVRMSPWEAQEVDTSPISEWRAPGGTHSDVKEDFGYKLYVYGREVKDFSIIPMLDENIAPEYKIVPNDSTKQIRIVSDEAKDGGRVSIEITSADGRKTQKSRLVYSSASSAVLDFFDAFRAEKISVTNAPEAANPGGNAIDGDLSTRWTSKVIGAEGIFDFGRVIEFDAAAAAFWLGSERRYSYSLFGSEDGVNFTAIAEITSSGLSEDYEVNRFNTVHKARYIKFVNKGNTVNANGNITELLLLRQKEG